MKRKTRQYISILTAIILMLGLFGSPNINIAMEQESIDYQENFKINDESDELIDENDDSSNDFDGNMNKEFDLDDEEDLMEEIVIEDKEDLLEDIGSEAEEDLSDENMEDSQKKKDVKSIDLNSNVVPRLQLTKDTFESNGGKYTIPYILSNYNAFILENYTGTHIVGPVIVGGNFEKYLGGMSAPNNVCDYSHLVPSYIGGEANISGGDINACSDVGFYVASGNKDKMLNFIGSGGAINNKQIKYTDNYIDLTKWGKLREEAKSINESIKLEIIKKDGKLVTKPKSESVIINGNKLDIKSGTHILIPSDILKEVTINIKTDSDTKSTVIASNGKNIYLKPIFINGKEPESIEVNEKMSLVFSFPNSENLETEREITGHIVAPMSNVFLAGGNFNGTVIAKNITTSAEGHMWPHTNDPIVPPINKTINIPVEKHWEGKKLDSVTINLYADGKKIKSLELSETNNWKGIFTDLPKYDSEGKVIKYTIDESALSGYDVSISGSVEDGFNVTNKEIIDKPVVETVDIPVEKHWEGKKLDSVTINLYADGKKIKSLELSESTDWKGIFTDLPKYDSEGEVIKYTIDESALSGYDISISGSVEDGFKVINTEKTTPNIPNVPEETPGKAPTTGDKSYIYLYIILILVSIFSLSLLRKRKMIE